MEGHTHPVCWQRDGDQGRGLLQKWAKTPRTKNTKDTPSRPGRININMNREYNGYCVLCPGIVSHDSYKKDDDAYPE
jgi:hypothetical protein